MALYSTRGDQLRRGVGEACRSNGRYTALASMSGGTIDRPYMVFSIGEVVDRLRSKMWVESASPALRDLRMRTPVGTIEAKHGAHE